MRSTAPRAGAEHEAGATLVLLAAVALAAGGTGACGGGDDRAPAVTLWLGGDVHLGDGAEADERLAAVTPLAGGALGVVNLEGAVSEGAAREGELLNHPARLAGLRRAGVIAAAIANNHARDAGAAAPATSAAALRAAGIAPVGGTAGVAIVERGGLRVAITAHELPAGGFPTLDRWLTPGGQTTSVHDTHTMMRPGGQTTSVADTRIGQATSVADTSALAAELAAARARADVLVATFHVTAPPSYLPPPEALTAAALARAAGASVIAFHGSHAIARVERDGATVTAFGLGNLLFACPCTDEEDGLLLRVTLDRRGVRDAEVIPVAAGLRGAPARPAAEPALIYELLASLRSTPLAPAGLRARLLPR